MPAVPKLCVVRVDGHELVLVELGRVIGADIGEAPGVELVERGHVGGWVGERWVGDV